MKTPIEQLFIGLTEDASEHLEALLAAEVCPQHNVPACGSHCLMCDADEAQHRANTFLPRTATSLLATKAIQ